MTGVLQGYGQTTYLSTNFRQVPRGTEGAVSLEGTLAGMIAAVLFTVYANVVGLVSPPYSIIEKL